MRPQAPVRTTVAALSVALVASTIALLGGSAAVAAPSGPSGPSGAAPSAARAHAEKTLSRAEALLVPSSEAHASLSRPAPGATSPRRDATIALRDLGQVRQDLSPSSQRRADRLLARPVLPTVTGTDTIAIHAGPSVAQPFVQSVLATAAKVHDTYVAAGYRQPLQDGVAGGDARLDIYLTDLGGTGAYGYCTSDVKSAPGRADKPAFCVLDDNYAGYPGDPTQVLQVTLAHEYFHAVQYAYDSLEDGWFMEGTAAWVEDYVFDDVNDNMQYAPYSPLAGPRYSLDIFGTSDDPTKLQFRQYGAWLWFRWLSERYPDAQGGLPTIVRQFWEAADSTQGSSHDRYSVQAINAVLRERGTTLTKAFATFADANRRPTAFYSEAAANRYPTAPLASKVKLSKRGAKSKTYRLDHLASATTRFVPKKVSGKRYKLKLSFDLAAKNTDPAVVVSTYLRSGQVKTKLVKLNGRGGGATKVPFSKKKVSGVEVTLVNASTRYTSCYRYAVTYSCYGKPRDQRLPATVRARVVG